MLARRYFVIALGLGAIATHHAIAQQPLGPGRIGFLSSESSSNQAQRVEALRAGLRELGYIEGKNLSIEVRWAEGNYDRLPALATELVSLNVAVIVASGAKATMAAKRVTTSIPIVMETGDALTEGIVINLARPEGNITGWTFFAPELAAKRLELLKEYVPRISRVAYLVNPADPGTGSSFRAIQSAAKALHVAILPFEVRGPGEFKSAFAAMAEKGCGAVLVQGDTMFAVNGKALADLAIKHRFPSAGIVEFAEAGGLIGVGVDMVEGHRRLAPYVDKILKGANPGDLPIEQATNFDLVVNAKTAKAIGLTIPQSLLLRANRLVQ
jgi:putative ABC transport system substrate-binding protein